MQRVIAGGYAEAGTEGLYLLEHGPGSLLVSDVVAPVRNVSAGIADVTGTGWFFVDEMAGELVLLDAARDWRERARVPSGGEQPCHLALAADRRHLAVAHYGSGTIALFALDGDGAPCSPPARYQHHGGGSNAERQDGPHAHWVGFDAAGRLYVTDLGTDQLLVFGPDDHALAAPRVAYQAPPGSGPRQIAFHPTLSVVYLVSELAATITVLDVADDGTLQQRRIHATLPDGVERGDTLGGAILLRGDRLFVSNRGHDSVATFAIDDAGDLHLLAVPHSGGASPRFLLIDAGHLLVAHEQAGGVTLLPLGDDGVPGAVIARADVPGAAFLGVL
ncbi:beta-propeller fold lactonase family protein [uncultured Sphingomonas sp.]|uniref:lactonase family protein n=1 Tax=uncultured Sphingomonas sp. TaxID=158754 RepID=UPI00261D88C7|nr:beta-propeller fold lactonase family protein [uncultured Sphingomonas sp.]